MMASCLISKRWRRFFRRVAICSSPADVGLVEGDRRRVAGLRREEVAMLAGISAEYYLRLEQGRERQPSDRVLESLASALQLNDDATEYMRNLARPAPRRRRRGAASTEKADRGQQTLIDSRHLTPACVQGRHMNILVANPMARALLPYFAPGANHCGSCSWSLSCVRGYAIGTKSPNSSVLATIQHRRRKSE
jgi:transcriptional regulator with XRE-family HTH domain